MSFVSLFVNSYGHARSGWRFLIFLLVFIGTGILFGFAAQAAISAFPPESGRILLAQLLIGSVFSLIAALFAGWVCGKLLERLPFRALGCWFTGGWLKNLSLGVLLGAVSIGVAVLVAVVFGGLSFRLNPDHTASGVMFTLAASFAVFAVAAAFEEALFRGYVLQTFSRAGLAWFAIGMTSLVFGAVHARNPDAGAISIANTALAGIWFGVAYLKTRDLWFPFGIHFIWNWLQGAVFGIEVSGLKDITQAPLLQEIDRGPAWFTGENYGIEGGIACTIAILVSIAIIYYLPILKPDPELLAMTSSETRSSGS
jgi:uncharacterized protein